MVEYVEGEERVVTGPPVAAPRRTPWHLWAVGVISLLWNCFGAYDYTMSQTGNAVYLEAAATQMGATLPQVVDYFGSFPAWMVAFWALGVWGALAGSLLLLLRSRFAVASFALSLVGLAVSTFYQVSTPAPEWVQAGTNSVMTIVIWSVATFLLIYSVSMARKGVLR